MTERNYNDGNWHAWEGGKCPVHPQSIIEVIWSTRGQDGVIHGVTRQAVNFQPTNWMAGPVTCIQWFRVAKEYREPRRFWVGVVSGTVSNRPQPGMIEVVEVIK